MQKLKIIYAGTPDFAVPALKVLIQQHHVCAVFTQPDRPAGRGRKVTASPVKQIAIEHNIPVHQPTSLKAEDQHAIIAAYQADVMIVAAYGLILPEAVLALPRLGCLNIHASWLPRWRGAAPIQRAILANDTETGISIMQMAKGLDTGDVLCLEGCAIQENETAKSLHDKLSVLGAEAIIDALQQIIDGTVVHTPQQENLVTYADKITKAEAKLNWQHDAFTLERAVRAFYGWPVAFTEIAKQTLRIWQTQVIAAKSDAAPGTIIGVDKYGIDVATGKGVLRLLKIQWPGKKIITVAEALNAHDNLLVLGKRFN
jgi:methionyl-tRNA formyltransferase